jgi:hypothetical protein
MIRRKLYSLVILTGMVLLFSGPAHAQFVAIARKIKTMHTSQVDVASVMLDAKTSRVYQAVIDTLTADPKVTITNRDNNKRLVEFTHGKSKVSIQVDSLATGFCQITVAAPHSDDAQKQSTDIVTDAITKVCTKAGIKCTIEPAKK